MMRKSTSGLGVVFALGLAMSLSAGAESMPSGKMIADTCSGCHGFNGVSAGPAIPSIAGLSKPYFVDAMMEYKSDKRASTIMGRIAKGYSDEEIEAMATEFSKMRFLSAKQEVDAKKAKRGAKLHDKYCEKCHAEGGSLADDDAGLLAGQWKPFLQYTLEDFRAKKRKMPKKMAKKMKRLIKKKGEGALGDLIEFYASK
jgi:cytochrome subunit of sulfide dehydrogenase